MAADGAAGHVLGTERRELRGHLERGDQTDEHADGIPQEWVARIKFPAPAEFEDAEAWFDALLAGESARARTVNSERTRRIVLADRSGRRTITGRAPRFAELTTASVEGTEDVLRLGATLASDAATGAVRIVVQHHDRARVDAGGAEERAMRGTAPAGLDGVRAHGLGLAVDVPVGGAVGLAVRRHVGLG